MIDAIFKILGAGLSIWESKEKRKYIDRMMSLQKSYYEEINKPFNQRDNAALDDIEFQLRTLGLAFASSAGKPDTGSSP